MNNFEILVHSQEERNMQDNRRDNFLCLLVFWFQQFCQGLQGQLSCPFLPKQRHKFFFLKKGTGALPLIKVEEAKCDLQSTRPIRLHLGLIILTQPLYRGPD
jgi:hypothetical protein